MKLVKQKVIQAAYQIRDTVCLMPSAWNIVTFRAGIDKSTVYSP